MHEKYQLTTEDAITYGQSIAANAGAIYGVDANEGDGNIIAAIMLAVMDGIKSDCACDCCTRMREMMGGYLS